CSPLPTACLPNLVCTLVSVALALRPLPTACPPNLASAPVSVALGAMSLPCCAPFPCPASRLAPPDLPLHLAIVPARFWPTIRRPMLSQPPIAPETAPPVQAFICHHCSGFSQLRRHLLRPLKPCPYYLLESPSLAPAFALAGFASVLLAAG
ncbi:hypothetical protein BRADI_2g14495v3, partial [Brachypodium distachyon]